MKLISPALFSFFIFIFSTVNFAQNQPTAVNSESYLSWSSSQAESTVNNSRISRKAGNSLFDLRGIHQNKAINYKVRATLMSPEVIRATARYEQLRNRLTDDETRKLVSEADSAGDLVVMIEIDPNEGSGVIPVDWRVFLQPKNLRSGDDGAVPGTKSPEFRKFKAFSGVARRDYDYDVFWVTFPLVDENKKLTISSDVPEIELVVGIYGKEAKLSWRMPESVRAKMLSLSKVSK